MKHVPKNFPDPAGLIPRLLPLMLLAGCISLMPVARALALDTIKPTLSITLPVKGEKWSNAVFTVSGKAHDNVAVSNVLVSCDGAGFAAATTGNNWSNWTAHVNLVPGTNTIAAYAVDTSGNLSATNKVNLIYVVVTTLAVSTNGNGTVTPDYNNKSLELGLHYSMAAKAGTGFGFVDWTDGDGDVITNGATLKFVMESNLTFIAIFRNTTAPTLTITNPAKSGISSSNSMFTVAGKASDNVGISNVLVSLNGGAWMPATLSDNGSNWMLEVSLALGTNTISAYAVDDTGLHSKTATVTIDRGFTPTAFPIFQNSTFKNPQAEIAFDGTNYMVAFQNHANGSGIPAAQLVSRAGDLIGSQFQVPWVGGADPPKLGFDGTNYLLAWGDLNNQTEGPNVFGQFVDTSGAAVGSPFTISQSTTVDNFATMVYGGGVYFAMWADNREANITGSDDLYGAMVGPDGSIKTSDFEISPAGVQDEAGTGTAAFDGTNFLATWGGAAGKFGLNGRLISPAGTFITDTFTIYTNSALSSGKALSSVVFDGTNYLVLFTVGLQLTGSPSTCHVIGRFVTTSGEVLTNQVDITSDTGPQIVPCGAFDGSHYLITWNQGLDVASASSSGSIMARFLNADGTAASGEFKLFVPATGQTALWAPVLFDGSQYFSVGGLGHFLSTAPKLQFTNGIIEGTFVSPQ